MTVGVFIDRLEQFRQSVLQYRGLSEADQRLYHNGSGTLNSSESNSLRESLCRQFTFLDEPVGVLSKGRYHIHLDSRGREDIYVQALSEDCQAEHLDLILRDLEHMLTELQDRPRHDSLSSQDQWRNNPGTDPQPSFGSLGHLGYSATPDTSATLHAALNTVARVIHQRVRPEDREKLLAHMQAIVDHPEMTDLLPVPSSQFR
ncbi:MAG: hypothetical protein KC592_00625 [Nitrospira sp.]|nr:hypothetical protein [Nitrospira sp.]